MGRATFWQQTKILLYRNWLNKSRKKSQTLQEIVFPIYLMVILLVLSLALPSEELEPITYFPPKELYSSLPFPVLAYSPKNSSKIDSIMNLVGLKMNVTSLLPFENEDEIRNYYILNPGILGAGLVFQVDESLDIDKSNPQVTILMNGSYIPSTRQLQASPRNCRTEIGSCPFSAYVDSNFLLLQQSVEESVFQSRTGLTLSMDIQIQQLPKPKFLSPNASLSTVAALYVVIAFSPIVQFLLINIVAEKESKIREGMMMMGLKNTSLIFSWFITYAVVMSISSLIMTILAIFGRVVPNANFLVIFLLLFLYGLTTISYSFILVPMFNKSKTAGAVGSLLTSLLGSLYAAIIYTNQSAAVKWACCLISPIALALGFGEAVYMETLNEGATFSNINTGFTTPGFSILSCLIMMLVDIVIYLFLAWYFDSVIPGEYGTKLKPWFLFMPSYWFPKRFPDQNLNEEEMETEKRDDVEIDSPELLKMIGIKISNISKNFRPLPGTKAHVKALESVTINMYLGQIFGLLGHNGAGKTTLVSILSGLYPATKGQIKILGLDVSTQMDEIRQNMGVCPQQNILLDELTVEEHLKIFAAIKGVPEFEIEAQVKKTIEEIDLKESEKKRSSTLSGGQKRKLCVGMAMIGNPTVVFLDEPTAGMDPYSRRKLWDLLQTTKKDKVILLTTHFMDEADILADRKAILNKGKVRCLGSSLFLKNRFGLGYYLNILKKNDNEDVEWHQTVFNIVSGSKLHKSAGSEVSFVLPLDQINNFPKLLKEMENLKDRIIETFSISMTTLEEVFIKLEHESKEKTEEYQEKLLNNKHIRSDGAVVDIGVDDEDFLNVAQKSQSKKKQLQYLTYCRLIETFRNKGRFIGYVIIPIIFVIIGLIIFKVIPTTISDETPIELVPSTYPQTSQSFQYLNLTQSSLDNLIAKSSLPFVQVYDLVENFYNSFLIGEQGTDAYGGSIFVQYNLTERYLKATILHNDTYVHITPILLSEIQSSFYEAIYEDLAIEGLKLKFSSYPLEYQGTSFEVRDYVGLLMIALALNFTAGYLAVEIVKERQKNVKHQLTIMGLPIEIYWLASFIRDFLIYMIPGSLVLILVWAFSISGLTGNAFLPFFLLVILYIIAMIPLCYCASFAFNSYEICQSYFPPLLTIISSLPYSIIGVVDSLGYRDTAKIFHYVILAVNPGYAIFGGIHYINILGLIGKILNDPPSMADYFNPDNIILPTILILIAHIFILCALLYFLDFQKSHKKRIPKQWPQEVRQNLDQKYQNEEDSDVYNERKNIDGSNHPVRVQNLRKLFQFKGSQPVGFCKKAEIVEKVAVDDLCFAVSSGECLGLLGPNGAGKTTALSMITCDLEPTLGTASICNHDILSERSQVFNFFGFCPQFDALFEDLSLKQQLLLYANIKGIPNDVALKRVSYIIHLMGLNDHTNKSPRHLSGGSKRKLSFAIAIVGSPEILILDEPSTGMDPSTRRKMWEIILSNKKGRATILTTHSMEEADALCSRIGIMVKGKLKCIGTSQRLKQKYGDGYLLDIKTTSEKVSPLKEAIKNHFPGSQIAEEYGSRLQYKIDNLSMNLSEVFEILENNRSELEIEDYSFSQTTLEQVFINFAKIQDE